MTKKYDLKIDKSEKKQLVPIGWLAHKLNVSQDIIRKWEKEGLITSNRTAGGHRRYDSRISCE